MPHMMGARWAKRARARYHADMSRSNAEIENLEFKLDKRGFKREIRPIFCEACGERANFIYAVKHTKMGGRMIEWCHACGNEVSWRRPDGDERVVDESFDLERFLA